MQNLRVTLQCASLAPNQLGFKPLTIYINLKISIWKAHHLPRARCIDDIHRHMDTFDTKDYTRLHAANQPKEERKDYLKLRRQSKRIIFNPLFLRFSKYAWLRETTKPHESSMRF